jgi:xanthine dehydrogenase molybdopterin-binding subunit B
MPLDTSLVRKPFKVIGTRVRRPDGIDKVTGRAKYGADAFAPGQLVGLVLRSPHAHAKIKKIDTSKAEKLAGVKAVITSADLPDLTGGDRSMRDILENCMARTKALYDGHAVAAVAAVDMHTAKQALKLIKVDYQVLPHVTDHCCTMTSSLKASSPSPRNHPTSSRLPSMAMAMWKRVSRTPTSSSRSPTRLSRRTRATLNPMPASPTSRRMARASSG